MSTYTTTGIGATAREIYKHRGGTLNSNSYVLTLSELRRWCRVLKRNGKDGWCFLWCAPLLAHTLNPATATQQPIYSPYRPALLLLIEWLTSPSSSRTKAPANDIPLNDDTSPRPLQFFCMSLLLFWERVYVVLCHFIESSGATYLVLICDNHFL